MNKTAKHSVMALLAATVGLCASFANAQTTATAVDRVYAIDQRGDLVVALRRPAEQAVAGRLVARPVHPLR